MSWCLSFKNNMTSFLMDYFIMVSINDFWCGGHCPLYRLIFVTKIFNSFHHITQHFLCQTGENPNPKDTIHDFIGTG